MRYQSIASRRKSTSGSTSMSRMVKVGFGLVVLFAVIVGAIVVKHFADPADGADVVPSPEAALTLFESAVAEGRPGAATVGGKADSASFLLAMRNLAGVKLEVETRTPQQSGTKAAAPTTTVWKFGTLRWTTSGLVNLRFDEPKRRWIIEWSLSTLDSRLKAGDILQIARRPLAKGRLVDDAGQSFPLDMLGKQSSLGRVVLAGLEVTQEERLKGQPDADISVLRAGENLPIESVKGQPGEDVATTIDVQSQRAAENALASEERPSALVAIQASTGEIIAAASGPTGSGSNLGFKGRVAPGSTFKVITATALLRRGLKPDSQVACPATEMGFKNAHDLVLGKVSFEKAFALSCNSTFIGQSRKLDLDELNKTATEFGIGLEYDIGLGHYQGNIPVNTGVGDKAAAAIGQGRDVVSPLNLAGVAATVASGAFRAPTLLKSASPRGGIPVLEPAEQAELRQMMRAVVTEGTAKGVFSSVAGDYVFAKTGTAEFGNETPLETHAWIIGFQGDVAFAVFVEGGESGGLVAGPIAARFLSGMH